MKKYKTGMYGGKFMPMHKGHLWCLKKASEECETVYLLMFICGLQEKEILKTNREEYLSVSSRKEQLLRAASMFPNVKTSVIDVTDCVLEDGTEDWDAETPLVNSVCGHLDAVYGSEPGYAAYFARAYPDAEYRLLDESRTEEPISATMVRNMSFDERKEWMI